MIHLSSIEYVSSSDAGRKIAELHHVLELAEEMAGEPISAVDASDEASRIGSAYDAAPAIAQRRFDALAAETADWAAAGVKILIASGDPSRPPRAAARRLADELSRSIRKLAKVVA